MRFCNPLLQSLLTFHPLNSYLCRDPSGQKIVVENNGQSVAGPITNALNMLNDPSKPFSYGLYKFLNDSPQTIYVKYWPSVGSDGKPRKTDFYSPVIHTIYIDPCSRRTAPTTEDPDDPVPLQIILAHEMGHARGHLLNDPDQQYDSDYGPLDDMSNVILNENPVRAEFGLPARISY